MNSVQVQHQILLKQWAGIINEQKESNLSVKAFVAQNSLSEFQFYYWKRKLKDAVLDEVSSGFVEIPVLPVRKDNVPVAKVSQPLLPSSNESVASISIGNSVINIYGNATQDFLKNLLGACTYAQ